LVAGAFVISSTVQLILKACLTGGLFTRTSYFPSAAGATGRSDATSFWLWGALIGDEAQLLWGLYLQLRLLVFAPFQATVHYCFFMPGRRNFLTTLCRKQCQLQ